MKIYKQPTSKFYHYDFYVDGKRHRGSTKTDKKSEANEYVNALQSKLRRMMIDQMDQRVQTISLSDAFDRAITGACGNTNLSYDLAKRKILGMVEGKFGFRKDIMLHEITDEHIDELKVRRKKEGLTDNSINGELRVLKRVHNLHKKRYLVNSQLEIKMLKGFAKSRYLSDREEMLVIRKLTGGESYRKALHLFLFLIDTGVRLGEALSANWNDIDLTKRQYEVYRQKTRSLSVVPLSSRVIDSLNEFIESDKPFHEMSRAVRVLRIAISDVCNTDQRVIETRGAATIHSLRDTFASRLVRQGMSLHMVSKLLGHASVAQSQKYAHLANEDVVDLARAMIEKNSRR